jgi:hypothetical protein
MLKEAVNFSSRGHLFFKFASFPILDSFCESPTANELRQAKTSSAQINNSDTSTSFILQFMKYLLAITAFITLAFANTEKNIFRTAETSSLNANDATIISQLESWAERNAWPVLNPPYTAFADTIRPRSALEDGPNPLNPENPHYEFQYEIPFQRWYRVHGLQPYGGYEARISYPATVGATCPFLTFGASNYITVNGEYSLQPISE